MRLFTLISLVLVASAIALIAGGLIPQPDPFFWSAGHPTPFFWS